MNSSNLFFQPIDESYCQKGSLNPSTFPNSLSSTNVTLPNISYSSSDEPELTYKDLKLIFSNDLESIFSEDKETCLDSSYHGNDIEFSGLDVKRNSSSYENGNISKFTSILSGNWKENIKKMKDETRFSLPFMSNKTNTKCTKEIISKLISVPPLSL